MKLYVGTSGFAYKPWKGPFYPRDLPDSKMLKYYGEQFLAVEANSSFYRMPTGEGLKKWAGEVPAEFRFVLKAPQGITHFKRLKGAEEPVAQLLSAAEALKTRLGPILFQLPPNMKKDSTRLADFLKLLPKKGRFAVEFRHASWFDQEVLDMLGKRNVAMCIAEAEEGVEVPFVATADWGYLRLRRPDYKEADLKAWLRRVRAQKWDDAFIFFKHEDAGIGPRMAKKLLELAK